MFVEVKRNVDTIFDKNCYPMTMTTAHHNQSGFTLLELLIVVFILSAIALTTVSFTTTADDQFRFEDTRTRLMQLRNAMTGQPDKVISGDPTISGFVTDVGRMPNCVRELLENIADNCLPTTPALPGWSFNPDIELWSGWNGPYISTLAEQSSGTRAFRDGWGNGPVTPDANFGWTFTPDQDANTLAMQSVGSDGTVGDTDPNTQYDNDFPLSGNLVEEADHQINLKGIVVTFTNPGDGTGPALPTAAEVVRVFVCYSQDGALTWCADSPATPTWPGTSVERDDAEYLSLTQTLSFEEVPDGGSVDKIFQFKVNDVTDADKFIPWGVRGINIVKDADGTDFGVGSVRRITLLPRTPVKLIRPLG